MRLRDVVAPPYDVVGPAKRARLAARSRYNAIHVELPEDSSGHDPYQGAASLWGDWHEQHVVVVDPEPALYLYRMAFRLEDGSSRATHGIIGALALDLEGAGDVLPHEETTPKERHGRLSLLGATRTNFSPIWALSLAGGLGELCENLAGGSLEAFEAVDDDGTVHTTWRVAEPALVRDLVDLVAMTPVLIADGHHRYATACAYASETGGAGSDAVMSLVVELSGAQLVVEAIHRLVSSPAIEEIEAAVASIFGLREGPDDPFVLYASLAPGEIGLLTRRGNRILSPRAGSSDELDTARLARALGLLPAADVAYQHGIGEVSSAVAQRRAEAAFLLQPVSIERIAATAHGGQRMPPKTTYFRPKPRTGMVFRELEVS